MQKSETQRFVLGHTRWNDGQVPKSLLPVHCLLQYGLVENAAAIASTSDNTL